MIAIVAQALVGLTRTAIRDRFVGAVGVATFAAFLAGVHELVVLATAGAVMVVWSNRASSPAPPRDLRSCCSRSWP